MVAHAQSSGTIPGAIQRKPELFETSAFFWDAFWFLSEGRPISAGMATLVQNITLSDMREYLDMKEVFDQQDREDFFILIRAMDKVYVPDTNAKLNAEKPKPS